MVTDTSTTLDRFSPPIRRWFSERYAAPTRVQAEAWPVMDAEFLAQIPEGVRLDTPVPEDIVGRAPVEPEHHWLGVRHTLCKTSRPRHWRVRFVFRVSVSRLTVSSRCAALRGTVD